MIIIRLAGGLGNQIFQLGAGLLLAKKSRSKKIILDDSALSKYEVMRVNDLLSFFELNKFNLEIYFKSLKIIRLRLPKLLPIKLSKFPLVTDRNFKSIVNNPNSTILIMDGYFQWELSQNNFDDILNILNRILINKNHINNTACVVHIRGGDFIKLGWNKITPEQYYLDAMKIMSDRYNIDNFIIVTDDKVYSQIILDKINYNYEFRCSDMINDFYTISSYSNRILSSSTFALWASALGNNNNGIVISPSYWFPNKKRTIYLKNEIRLGNY